MDHSVSIAVNGAAGRMGKAILRLAFERSDVCVAAALVRGASNLADRPVPAALGSGTVDLRYATCLPEDSKPSVLIDFSSPDGFDRALACARQKKVPFVSGTTGLGPGQRAALASASADIPVLWSANFSLGIAMLAELVSVASRALPDWDCTIAEAHHRTKKDAPSGTALTLGRAVAAARGQDLSAFANASEVGAARGAVDFAVTRAGDIVGEHTVLLATSGERIELTHRATDRDIFARGAIAAALWIAGRPPGMYSLSDVVSDGTGGKPIER